jgi:hypothetical protein
MIHDNSHEAYQTLKGLNKRCQMVVTALDDLGVATDRRIKEHLNLPDMNNVRPRVTELIKLGLLIECGDEVCDVTNKTVRRVRRSQPNRNQMELF